MVEIDKGHKYVAQFFEDPEDGVTIPFINKKKEGDELVTVYDGTTNEELIAILISRLKYLNELMHSEHNDKAISHLTSALEELEARTKDRVERNVEGTPKE